MKTIKKHIRMALATLCLLVSINCDNEDENVSQIDGVSLIDSDKGFNFTLTYLDGKQVKKTGKSVFGSFNNQLLDGDYSKSLHGSTDGFRFQFKFSIPKTVQSADVIEDTHQLRESRLRLEQTGNLGALQTEFWLGTSNQDDEFNAQVNVKGTAKYSRDIAAIGDRVAIAVEIDGSVTTSDGETVKIVGIFWKAKDDNI